MRARSSSRCVQESQLAGRTIPRVARRGPSPQGRTSSCLVRVCVLDGRVSFADAEPRRFQVLRALRGTTAANTDFRVLSRGTRVAVWRGLAAKRRKANDFAVALWEKTILARKALPGRARAALMAGPPQSCASGGTLPCECNNSAWGIRAWSRPVPSAARVPRRRCGVLTVCTAVQRTSCACGTASTFGGSRRFMSRRCGSCNGCPMVGCLQSSRRRREPFVQRSSSGQL